METKKFVLLDIDYITKNSKPIVRLFGRLIGAGKNGTIIAMDKNFKPYIYVLPSDLEGCINDLSGLGLSKVEIVRKKDNSLEKEFLKITLTHPRDIAHLKKRIKNLKSVKDIREHDILFDRRYLIDKGLSPFSEVMVKGRCINPFSSRSKPCIFEIEDSPKLLDSGPPELKVLCFIIEICTKGKPSASQDPISMICFSSNHGFKKVISTKTSSLDFVETVSNEKELIRKYVDTIKSENPDLIVGYHSDNFDFPYLKERASQLGVSIKLGMDGSKVKFKKIGHRNTASVKGRIHVDLYRVVRRHLQLNSHTLQNVYLKLYKEDKVDIPADEIYSCWRDDGEKLEKLFRYFLEDAIAITKIGERILPMSIELTRLVGQSLFEIVRRGTGTQVQWYLIRKSYEYGYILPNSLDKFERNVVGGYVEEPVPGLHENIVYFDFRSLYPSIIIAKNISPDTLTENCNMEKCHIAPEFGYKFRKKPIGFIPAATRQLLEERIRIKSMMKETTDPVEYQILNFRQEAIKTLISTIYGLFNHPQYRWYCIEASEAITAWGREYLKDTMEKAREHGFEPVYADTDGFYAVKINKRNQYN